jgi:beta-lactam-binding protein with PASTA domain
MAKLFQITLPEGLSTLNLDSKGHGTVHYSVKNVSARPIDGRAVLVCLPQGDPNSVQKGWISLEGKAERHFEVNGEDTFTVNVSVPPKSAAGTYSYRLDVVSVAKPDEGDSSQPTRFTVVDTVPPPKKWGLIAAIIAAVVIVAGVGIWLAMRHKKPTVPNLAGMTVANATAALTANNLQLDPHMDIIISQPSNSGLILGQVPSPGPVPSGTTSVHVQVGAATVDVPTLTGHTVADASANLLAPLQLSLGATTYAPSPGVDPGTITGQTPAAGTPVQTNSTIAVTVTPQTVNVPPNLVGMTLINAANSVRGVGLVPGQIAGDGSVVTSTNPAPGTSVPIGSPVNLTTTFSVACVQPCLFLGQAARWRVQPQLSANALGVRK